MISNFNFNSIANIYNNNNDNDYNTKNYGINIVANHILKDVNDFVGDKNGFINEKHFDRFIKKYLDKIEKIYNSNNWEKIDKTIKMMKNHIDILKHFCKICKNYDIYCLHQKAISLNNAITSCLCLNNNPLI